jgi:hypothetical protein
LARYIEFLRFRALQAHTVQERLARDYDELTAHYDELASELADEVWLPLENEALAGLASWLIYLITLCDRARFLGFN